MKYSTCPQHPGRIIDTHPCQAKSRDGTICGYSLPRPPRQDRLLHLVKEEDEVTVLTEPNVQVDIEPGGVFRQETLDAAIFPASDRREIPMVKIGFSGSVEMTQSEWQAYCDQGLEPGREVKVILSGFLPDPHAKWVKRSEKDELGGKSTWWEREGQIKVKVLELGGFELKGFYDGD